MRHLMLLCPVLVVACGTSEPTASPPSPLTAVSVLRDVAGFTTGPLLLTHADGRVDTVRVDAVEAWRLADGAEVAWSGRDGGGGYENEGQSLRIAAVDSTSAPRVVVRETFMIDTVEELLDSDGRRLLAVAMRDGGAGMQHLALVNPLRGVVYRSVRARLAERGDTLVIEHLEPEGSTKPSVVESLSIRELVVRPVLTP
jgi:hypothetical protein